VLSLVGALQAVVLCTVLIRALGLQPLHVELYYVTILLAMLSIAIFQFLVYLLGIAGDFIGVILLMLQLTSSAGSYPKETLPQFFINVSPYLPMTYAVSAFCDILSGHQVDMSSVFALSAAAIVLLVLLTSVFKWLFSRETVMIKQFRPARAGRLPGILCLNPLGRLKISSLKLSQGFRLAARGSA